MEQGEEPETETPLTDGQLIAAARLGDAGAWRELYERWMPWVWRYAYTLVQDAHAAEDVTSEAMTAWIKNFDKTGQDAAQSAAWLRSVIRHKAADHHRRSGRARRAMESLSRQEAPLRDTGPASRPLEDKETRMAVIEALSRLKETYRLPLEWKYAEGLSVREIATRLGATEKSVEANLYRARQEFRRQFAAILPTEPPSKHSASPIASKS